MYTIDITHIILYVHLYLHGPAPLICTLGTLLGKGGYVFGKRWLVIVTVKCLFVCHSGQTWIEQTKLT